MGSISKCLLSTTPNPSSDEEGKVWVDNLAYQGLNNPVFALYNLRRTVMQKESWKVFLACAFGAGIGALVALQVNHWFWWIGLLVGGLTGYLSYEWKAVIKAIPRAFRATTSWRPPKYALAFALWEPIPILNLIFFPVAILLCLIREQVFWPTLFVVCLAMATSFVTVFPVFFLLASMESTDREEESRAREVKKLRRVAFHTFPPVVLFWHLPRGLYWLIRRVPWFLAEVGRGLLAIAIIFGRFLGRFSWQMFIRIHSERRLICGVDAMIGASIGYFAHHVIIGALAGGIIGLINHAVVTERWLKPRGYLPLKS